MELAEFTETVLREYTAVELESLHRSHRLPRDVTAEDLEAALVTLDASHVSPQADVLIATVLLNGRLDRLSPADILAYLEGTDPQSASHLASYCRQARTREFLFDWWVHFFNWRRGE